MANMHWSTALYKAADAFDGGARSFPMASEAEIARRHGYEPPNEDYEKLFFCQASIPRSQRDPGARPHSAGWLIPSPDDASVCKPVFVAHSVLSAIWLLRETLADDALSNDGWDRLVCAAESLAEGSMVEPPSAQKPSASPLAQRRKRRAPSAPAFSPTKRARTEAGESPVSPSEPAEGLEAPDAQLAEEQQPAITSVTNNNRRAERQRIKAYEAAQVERSLDLGLVAPDKKAVDDERGAYAAVPVKDKAVIAWLFKQDAVDRHQKKVDFYNAVKTPYLKARDFLAKARALGSPSSQEHAAHFLQIWRKQGNLFGDGAPEDFSSQALRAREPRVHPSEPTGLDGVFCRAWDRCTVYEEVVKSVHIKYRWAQALLGKAMVDKLEQLKRSDRLLSSSKTSRFGKGQRRTEAIDALMLLIFPQQNPSKSERDMFRDRLAKAGKWYRIAEGLGWGVLLVMPEDVLPKAWIEQTIRSWGVDVFIELLKRERRDVCLAAKQFDEWLGPEGIAGGDIKGKKRLSIELNAPGAVHRIEEVSDSDADSDIEDDGGDDDGDGRIEIVQSQMRSKSAPAASLRQTTLPELFTAVA